ncbi:MAG: HTH domain-containing protein [Prevotella sp.]
MDNINLITELLKERFVTKQELMELTHLNERKVRKKIQKIKMTQPVISTCTRNGYKIATSEDDIILALVTVRELVIKIKSIARCINRLTAFIGKYNDKEIGKLF